MTKVIVDVSAYDQSEPGREFGLPLSSSHTVRPTAGLLWVLALKGGQALFHPDTEREDRIAAVYPAAATEAREAGRPRS